MGTRGSGRNVAVVSCKLQFQEIRALDAAARDAGMTRYAILQALVRRHLAQQDAADGTRFPDCPDYMTPTEIHEACIEYLADYYAPDWYPWKE